MQKKRPKSQNRKKNTAYRGSWSNYLARWVYKPPKLGVAGIHNVDLAEGKLGLGA